MIRRPAQTTVVRWCIASASWSLTVVIDPGAVRVAMIGVVFRSSSTIEKTRWYPEARSGSRAARTLETRRLADKAIFTTSYDDADRQQR